MSNRWPPFAQINKSIRTIQIEVGLTLGFEGIEWPMETYAFFLGLIETGKMMNNPTKTQKLAQLAAWFKYYNQVIDQMPVDHPLRSLATTALKGIKEPYEGVMG